MTSDSIASCRVYDGGLEEDEEDETEDGGVWFYVNKGGFPIDSFTWERMYKHVVKLHPGSKTVIRQIQNSQTLPDVAVPQAPLNFPPNTLIQDRLEIIQKYMSELQYNHTGTQFFEIKKNRPICGLMDSAKEIIRESLPIKCLEAVILALYLTLGIPALDRFPISFKTTFNGNTYRHVVLGVYSLGRYGALGMSRRDDLMYKPLIYKSLSALIKDFKSSYEKYWHTVKKVKIGVPVPHDPHSVEHINWKQLSLSVSKIAMDEMCKELDHHARDMRTQCKKRDVILLYTPSKPHPPHTDSSPSHQTRKSQQKTNNDKKDNRNVKSDKLSSVSESSSDQKKTKTSENSSVKTPNSSPINDQETKSATRQAKMETNNYQLRI